MIARARKNSFNTLYSITLMYLNMANFHIFARIEVSMSHRQKKEKRPIFAFGNVSDQHSTLCCAVFDLSSLIQTYVFVKRASILLSLCRRVKKKKTLLKLFKLKICTNILHKIYTLYELNLAPRGIYLNGKMSYSDDRNVIKFTTE